MDVLAFNWIPFIAVMAAVIFVKKIFFKIIPFDRFSILNLFTLGFFIFLIFPILGYSNDIAISIGKYSLLTVFAFFSFFIGVSAFKIISGNKHFKLKDCNLKNSATIFTFLILSIWIIIRFVFFVINDGPSRVMDVIWGGWAHFAEVEKIGEKALMISGVGLIQGFIIIAEIIFAYLWVILYKKWPKYSLLLWYFYFLLRLDHYVSRSELLGIAIFPYIVYLIINKPTERKIIIQMVGVISAVIILFSWYSSVRLGNKYTLQYDVVVADTIRDTGVSIVPATEILFSGIRGNGNDYLLSMAGFLIPRIIWKGKPKEQYNYDITYKLTGKLVGQGTSVITSTILGEAWYYFGLNGTFLLMLIIGFIIAFFDNLFNSDPLLLGGYITIMYQAVIQVRSTFLTLYQQGVVTLILGIIFVKIYRKLFGNEKTNLKNS